MSGFTESALEKKLAELNNSQQSIQTLSLWLIHHRKHHKTIVQVWLKELKKAKSNRKLTFMYLANDVIQNSKKKGPEFSREFGTVLGKAFHHVHSSVADAKTKHGLDRIINVWEERNVYDKNQIETFRNAMKDKSAKGKNSSSQRKVTEKVSNNFDVEPVQKKRKVTVPEESESVRSPPGEPPDAEDLIKALQDLENCPSTDAIVREKIARLPPEVSDLSLLDKIQDLESAEKLSKQVDEACNLLSEYNIRLSNELEDRKLLSKMLSDFTHAHKERLSLAEQRMEEYREKLKTVVQVRNELNSHLQNLPDLTLLPSVTGGLAPLPSAGDLFN